MKNILLNLLGIAIVAVVFGQSSADYAVIVEAEVAASPPQITLHWVIDSQAVSVNLFRKLKSESSWGVPLTTLPGTGNRYVDTNVIIGESYEYKLMKSAGSYTGYGYINCGIEIPLVNSRGVAVLIVDDSMAAFIPTQLQRFEEDLKGDGWKTARYNVQRNTPVTSVRALVVSEYIQNPAEVKAVVLIGHVPVPYSGNNAPDGHVNDHTGAWPADVYYGEMNGTWQDVSVNNTSAASPRNHNVPGDGKFDHTQLPSPAELQVGRIDFYNMPAFNESEAELLKKYFDKNHAYRHRHFDVIQRGAIDDNFGGFGGEAFAANGWRNFSGMFGIGASAIVETDFFNNMSTNSYKWSYGCGGGSYTSAGGIGNTNDFAGDSLLSVFMMLFGSYFGDWDTQNNFLRAPLASGLTLTNCWAGRPNWYFHHMSLGENIGYSTMLSQNNSTLYISGFGQRYCTSALMGDPTLRLHAVGPPANLTVIVSGKYLHLAWSASADSNILGYNIYRKEITGSDFVPVNSTIVSGNSFTDSCLYASEYEYMVKAIVLEESASGSYFNSSQGIFKTVNFLGIAAPIADFSNNSPANPVSFTNLSQNYISVYWIFGDGEFSYEENPDHQYQTAGTYEVSLVADNGCSNDTFSQTISVSPSGLETETATTAVHIYPIPAESDVNIDASVPLHALLTDVRLWNPNGKLEFSKTFDVENTLQINLRHLSAGMYFLELKSGSGKSFWRKVLVE